MKIIDIHSHFYPDNIKDMESRFGDGSWPGFRKLPGGKGIITMDGVVRHHVTPACTLSGGLGTVGSLVVVAIPVLNHRVTPGE